MRRACWGGALRAHGVEWLPVSHRRAVKAGLVGSTPVPLFCISVHSKVSSSPLFSHTFASVDSKGGCKPLNWPVQVLVRLPQDARERPQGCPAAARTRPRTPPCVTGLIFHLQRGRNCAVCDPAKCHSGEWRSRERKQKRQQDAGVTACAETLAVPNIKA
jgi:hypothetical protein